MKNKNLYLISAIALVFLGTLLFFSCNKKTNECSSNTSSEKMNVVSVAASGIGYINDAGTFVPISDDELRFFFSEIGFIGDAGVLDEYSVVSTTDPSGEELYAVSAKARDGSSYVSMSFALGNAGSGRFFLMDGGCSCKSVGCSTWGCNVSDFGPCSCSDCGTDAGICEKTSTRLTRAEISAIFS